MQPVSYLFVPGTRADRFAKAIGSGADRVIIDLEDAVAPDDKTLARANVREALAGDLAAPVLIRLNSPDSPWFDDDLAELGSAARADAPGFAGVIIPKLESVTDIERVRRSFDGAGPIDIIGLIESAVGLHAVDALAGAGLTRLGVGAIDLSFDLGGEVASPLIDVAYARIVIASRVAGIAAPIGSPPLELRDDVGTETAARRLKSMGVGGQLCIHPAQVAPIHAGFAPSADEVAWAHRVLAAEGAAAQVDGKMVDKPVRDHAERIVALHSRRNS